MMINRFIEEKFIKAVKNFKILYLAGARQTGKSTFVKYFAKKYGYVYVNFDDDDDRNLALNDPVFFFQTYKPPLIIDEIQKAPEIINRIKQIVDNRRENGLFILTGSANLLNNPRIQDTLTGRIALLNLYPFSNFETKKVAFNIVKALFDGTITSKLQSLPCAGHNIIVDSLCNGFFPAVSTLDKDLLSFWFENYIATRIFKEIDTLTEKNLYKHEALHKLIRLLAAQTANLLNVSNIAKDLKIHYQTAKSYIHFLEQIFITERVQPYHSNIGKQVLKTPKIYFIDTGLICYLTRAKKDLLYQKKLNFGAVLENFIFLELRKHSSFLINTPKIYYFRGSNREYEVDFIIENIEGELIAVEVKAASNTDVSELKGLKYFMNKNNVKYLYVFYGGNKVTAKQIADKTVYFLPYCKLL